VGWANGGSLVNARPLQEGDGIRFLPGRTLHHGTQELVGLLERVGRVMRRRFRAPITVGDLSAQCGGRVDRHRSHQSGRDADIAFFMRRVDEARGVSEPVAPQDYVSFTALGESVDHRFAFDTARNWSLVEALLTDPEVLVERIFVARAQRAALLRYARGRARPDVFTRAQWALLQPAHVSVHDNHFHVRIGCPRGDDQCRAGVRAPPRPARRRAQRAELRRGEVARARTPARR
jgi:penicillin-insensitive murein endopeptidase